MSNTNKRFPFAKVNSVLYKVEDNHDSINQGGCGQMAVILYEALENVVDDIRFAIMGGWEGIKNIDDLRPHLTRFTVDELERHGVENCHVWIEFKWKGRWYAVDSRDGIVSRRHAHIHWGKPHKGSPTLDEMRTYTKGGGWNPWFDRRQVPSMRKMVFNKLTELSLFQEAL